jgi:KDO2-lipid IV(A) lauroyltransferase
MLALIRWLSRRSLPFLHALGAGLGWLTWLLSPTYRRRLAANAAQAGLSPAQRRSSVAEAGRLVLEMPWLWLRPAGRPGAGWVEWHGAERIDAALEQGRGIVFLTPHLGCFEVCAQAYAERFGARQPVTVLYSPARQPWLRTLEEQSRERPGLLTAPATLAGVRQMLRALRRGECVGLLPDQVPPQGLGVWAPFFGRPAYTMTLAAKLALQSGAPLLVMWAERLDGGRGWRLWVDEAPPLPAGEGEEGLQASATAINAEMERLIRQRPEQYLWSYNRYKQPRAELAR